MRHKAELAGIGFLGTLLFSLYFCRTAVIAAVIIFVVLSFISGIVARVHKNKDFAAKLTVVFVASAIAATHFLCYDITINDKLKSDSGKTVHFSGSVIELTDRDNFKVTAKGKIDGVPCKKNIYLSDIAVDNGSEISLSGKFDLYDSKTGGISGCIVDPEDVTVMNPRGIMKVYNMIISYRELISDRISAVVGEEEASVLKAMLCGDTSSLTYKTRRTMQRCGIGHILAVSGLHVSLAASFAAIISKFLPGRFSRFIFTELFTLAYTVFTGLHISSLRAFIMITIFLCSRLILRKYSLTASLSVCVIIICIIDPTMAAEPSFLLSVSGVFAVGAISPMILKQFTIKNKIIFAIVGYITVSVCAEIAVFPIVTIFFDEAAILTTLINTVFVPIFSFCLLLCMIFVITGGTMSFIVKISGTIIKPCLLFFKSVADSGMTSIPLKHDFMPVIIIVSYAFVALLFLITKDIKRSSLIAISAYTLTVLTAVSAFAFDDSVGLYLYTDSGKYFCSVYSGNECIVIDSDCGSYNEYERFITKYGITNIRCAVLPENGYSGFTSYYKSDLPPDIFIMTSSALPSSEEHIDFGKGGKVSIYGLDIDINYERIKISGCEGGNIIISKSGVKEDSSRSITVFKKILIYESDALKPDSRMKIRLLP